MSAAAVKCGASVLTIEYGPHRGAWIDSTWVAAALIASGDEATGEWLLGMVDSARAALKAVANAQP